MHHSEWSRIERGQVEPRLTTLIQIQQALGIASVEALFGRLPSRTLIED